MEPIIGFEPMTVRLQGECSTSWAILAYFICERHIIKNHKYVKTFFEKNIFLEKKLLYSTLLKIFVKFNYDFSRKNKWFLK